MHEFKPDDVVTLRFKGQDCHGRIMKVGKKNAEVYINNIHEFKRVSLDRLTFVPPIMLTPEQTRQLCRYEVKWSEFQEGHPDFTDVYLESPYTMTFEDMLAAARNIIVSDDDNETVREEWYDILYYFLYEAEEGVGLENTPDDVEMLEYLPDRSEILSDLFYTDLDELLDIEAEPVTETISDIIKRIKYFLSEEQKPILKRAYSDADKENYIDRLGNDDRLKTATELELTVYRKFIEDLIPKDNHKALKRKGYGCYGGDPAYECDWNTALECVTRLYELTGKPVYANTLGYIYYYGRCWDGEPKYNEAFKYFSVGAAGYYYESRYKLADMFVHGYGVPQNTKTAYTIVSELYDQNVKYMLDGDFDCKFADVALRMGIYAESGYGYTNVHHAYKYYLQAEFAIRQRLKYDHYGDLSVADSIRKRLNNLLESGQIKKPKRSAYVDLYELFWLHLRKYRKLRLDIKQMKNGDVKLSIRIAPFKEEKYPPKLFITEEETGFCGMLEMLIIRVNNAVIRGLDNNSGTVIFDDMGFYSETDYKNGTGISGFKFMLGDEMQVAVIGGFKFTSPLKASGKKYRFASVYFSPGGKHYDYLLDIDGVEVGDTVCVMTDRGKTEVTVAAILEKAESELALPIGKYKKIIEKV